VSIEVVGIDGDDTLWRNEDYFAVSQELFRKLLTPYVNGDIAPEDLDRRLADRERSNLELFGYGVKGFTLSMIETAIELSAGTIGAPEIQTLLDRGKEMLAHPVELLPGVAEAVEELGRTHRLVLVTKGDLFNQEQKVARSGLADHFERVEIVAEKDPLTYERILARLGVPPQRFVMAGNSVRSDVLPVLAIGGRAVHIPYELTWVHEHAEHDGSVPVLESLGQLPGWLARQG
jgi:putative hydrolase of the HAD superfamily